MKDLPINTIKTREIDATVFGFAQNEANPTDVPVGTVLSGAAPSKLLRSQPVPRALGKKIQAICNGKSTPFAMQEIETTREKPPAQEQWVSMKEQCEEQWKAMKNAIGG